MFAPDSDRLNLKEIGCSNYEQDTVSFGDAWNPPQFNWLGVLGPTLAYNLAVVLAVSLGIYVLVRAIGLGHWRLCSRWRPKSENTALIAWDPLRESP